jgi:hypothetical protein
MIGQPSRPTIVPRSIVDVELPGTIVTSNEHVGQFLVSAQLLGEINATMKELRTMMERVLPLVEKGEQFLNMTPMERLRAGLKK